jgi:sec-independent protein translocase protein TatA
MDTLPHIVPGFFNFGSSVHWLVILFIALLLFGRRVPEMMRSLGGSIRAFKAGVDEMPTPDDLKLTSSDKASPAPTESKTTAK